MLVKAKLIEIRWDAEQTEPEVVDGGKSLEVHFNPETLSLNYANQSAGGESSGGSATQHLGSGTTKLSLELLFDTTREDSDVRQLTEAVAYFLQAQEQTGDAQPVPPGIRVSWGSFLFDGVVDSMDETLEYFSEEGVPLRATVRLALSRQAIEFKSNDVGGGGGAGASPLSPARTGDTARSLASRAGRGADWKSVASANGVDDPLRLPVGSLFDVGGR